MSLLSVIAISLTMSFGVTLVYEYLKRYQTTRLRVQDGNMLSATLSFICTIFALLLAFSISDFWTRYDNIRTALVNEASNLQLIYRLLRQSPDSASLIAQLRAYLESVVKEGFSSFRSGIINERTNRLKIKFEESLIAYVNAHSKVPSVNKLLDLLDTNIFEQKELREQDPRFFISIVTFLAILTLIAMWFVDSQRPIVHFILDFVMITLVITAIYTLYLLNRPFADSPISLTTAPFETVLREMAR